jgi:hypothetical protein
MNGWAFSSPEMMDEGRRVKQRETPFGILPDK